jgi:sporulation protein YlmC with PRC-barrel domain
MAMRMAMKRMRMKSVVAATAVTVALCASPVAFAQQSGMPGASKLMGTTVVNDANESIGKINEVVLSKDGKVAAVVIGVGGFLGVGEREVAVNFESLRIAQDSNNKTTVSLNATKDSLKSAPEWQWIGDRSGTTGNSSAPTQQPVSK